MKTSRPQTRHASFRAALALLVAAFAFATSSCMSDPYGPGGYGYGSTPAQRGAITGAVAGGIIGGVAREDVGGAALGAAIGAIAGAATGQAIDNNRRRQRPPNGYRGENPNVRPPPPVQRAPYPPRNNQPGYRPVPPTPPTPSPAPAPPRTSSPDPDQKHYPTATKTKDPNRVLSPYPPNNMIDVEGFRSGDIAIDPTTEKIFRIP